MLVPVSRKQMFARLRGGPVQLRPPWAKDERAFTDACTACGACLAACPNNIITLGHAGYPIVDFLRGGCTFCGACAEACEAGSFLPAARAVGTRTALAPWPLKAAISAACVERKGVTCRMCEEHCETLAILFRPKQGGGSTPAVAPADCTGCGACVAACPVQAISIQHNPETAEVHE